MTDEETSMLWLLLSACGAHSDVVINELMASNATILEDSTGHHPDWIELFNTSSAEVPLDGYVVIDNHSGPEAGVLDGLSVPANGYLLLFADDTGGDGHLAFKLNASGDAVSFGTDNGDGTIDEVERVAFGAQTTDSSYARIPDGGADWEITDAPTPGATNGGG
jgi:hypothetical protein